MKSDFRLREQIARAVLEVSCGVNTVDDIFNIPDMLEAIIKKYLPMCWMGLYVFSGDIPKNVTTNPSLPFNWDQLYYSISDKDKLLKQTLASPIGVYSMYNESLSPMDEDDYYCREFVLKHTQTYHCMSTRLMGGGERGVGLGVYRTDKKLEFTETDKIFMERLSPVLASAANGYLLFQENGYKRAALDWLVRSEKLNYAILSNRLSIIELPLTALNFLRRVFQDCFIERLPQPIEQWIQSKIAPGGHLKHNTGPWSMRLSLAGGNLLCHAYVVQDDLKKPVLLIKFELHGETEDFSILQKAGFTPRETEALSYIPLGYSNQQIAMAMDISADGVKKHLRNIARKLNAERKAEVLFQAMQLKKQVEYLASIG
ncbi:helix-turn-helix transcriptional regulator [Desulfatibacillum aliphaticivorans]|uniref:helix-turn-helix transcriptional regulator n=1 Tax=Desulfatibacillum aliphaticivorans TaxID=218208 RepID=UPI000484BBCC|nr:helix-turn-helix transcriptional regulator [Desulfatibacillum aliphaticivorans]